MLKNKTHPDFIPRTRDGVKYPDCISENAKTFDEFVFEYFNQAYTDEVSSLMEKWEKMQGGLNDPP